MAIRERRQREVAEREERILDVAEGLIQDEGLLNLQMSRLAETADCAVGTLYQHFARKEDLLVALASRTCRSRLDLYERAAAWPGPARERLLAIALADTLLQDSSPGMFRLSQFVFTEVIWSAASPARRAEAVATSAPIEALVSAIVGEAAERGELPHMHGMTPVEVALGVWTQCLGMHTLIHAKGRLEGYDRRRSYGLLFKHLNHLLNGYGWQPLMPVIDDTFVFGQIERLCRDVFAEPAPFAACVNTNEFETLRVTPS